MSSDFHSIGLPFPLILSSHTKHHLEFLVFDEERTFTIDIRTSRGIWIHAAIVNLEKKLIVMMVVAIHLGLYFELDQQTF